MRIYPQELFQSTVMPQGGYYSTYNKHCSKGIRTTFRVQSYQQNMFLSRQPSPSAASPMAEDMKEIASQHCTTERSNPVHRSHDSCLGL